MNAIQKSDPGSIAERVVILGDLSQLGPQQRSEYYIQVCHSLGLNPLTRPFSYLKLNGREILYANRDCTDQLRQRDKVSVTIVSRERTDDLIIVTARATLPDGRADESIGAIPLGNLKGEPLANAIMKAETKAKRRVTLSICGLGFMDESEVDGALADQKPRPEPDRLALSPHADSREGGDGDSDLFADLLHKLEAVKSELPHCDSYDRALSLRGVIGTKAKQSDLTKRIQAGGESGHLTADMRKELGKLWMHCDRQVSKLEEKLKPALEASFSDEPAAEEPMREPGADEDEDLL